MIVDFFFNLDECDVKKICAQGGFPNMDHVIIHWWSNILGECPLLIEIFVSFGLKTSTWVFAILLWCQQEMHQDDKLGVGQKKCIGVGSWDMLGYSQEQQPTSSQFLTSIFHQGNSSKFQSWLSKKFNITKSHLLIGKEPLTTGIPYLYLFVFAAIRIIRGC